MDTTEYSGIYHGVSTDPGKLRIATAGIAFMPDSAKGDKAKMVTTQAKDIKWLQWTPVARGQRLTIGLKSDQRRVTYDGFPKDDLHKLQSLTQQHYQLSIDSSLETSVRGWNWGTTDVQSQDLVFQVQGKTAFTLPLVQIHNTTISKAEVSLEFSAALKPADVPSADSKDGKARRQKMPDELVELKWYLPGSAKEAAAKRKKANTDDADGDTKMDNAETDDQSEAGEDDAANDQTAAQAFHDVIKEKAEGSMATGDAIISFPEVLCTTPRGRFDVDMFDDSLRLRGKTYDYRIMYTSIKRLFLLSKPDEIHSLFAVNLEPPIRQGQTRYPYMIMQFSRDEEMDAEMNLEEEELKTRFNGRLEKKYEAPAYEVVSNIFKIVSGVKLTTAGAFQNHAGHSAVKANLKANEGHIYFLEKSLFYLSKNPLYIPYSSIHKVSFERVAGALGSSRSFDLSIDTDASSYTFNSIVKEEKQFIEDYLKEKKITVIDDLREDAALGASVAAALLAEDSDSDTDMDAPKKKKGGSDDEDEESVDEDFKANSDDEEVGEEFDENFAGSSSGSSDSGESGSEDEEGDDDEAGSDAPASDVSAEKPPKKKQKQK